jgi:predicted N-acetyltransferase YhbS
MVEDTHSLVIKYASQSDYDQVHKLNHSIFAEEIPQHERRENSLLVDHMHELNTYIIAQLGDEIVGMVCYNAIRPFSIDKKLPNLDNYLPAHKNLVEVRLFAVKKEYRKHGIGIAMLKVLIPGLISKGCDLGVISGTPKEIELYKNIGAVTFGPMVGTEQVPYQPMYFSLESLKGVFRI